MVAFSDELDGPAAVQEVVAIVEERPDHHSPAAHPQCAAGRAVVAQHA